MPDQPLPRRTRQETLTSIAESLFRLSRQNSDLRALMRPSRDAIAASRDLIAIVDDAMGRGPMQRRDRTHLGEMWLAIMQLRQTANSSKALLRESHLALHRSSGSS